MILHQALVGFGDDPIAKLGELLADNDVERELLELAYPRQSALAGCDEIGGRQEGVEGAPDKFGWATIALGRYGDDTIIFITIEPDRAVLESGGQTRPPSREAGGVSKSGPLIAWAGLRGKNIREGQSGVFACSTLKPLELLDIRVGRNLSHNVPHVIQWITDWKITEKPCTLVRKVCCSLEIDPLPRVV